MTDIIPSPIRGATFVREMTVKPASGSLVGSLVELQIKRRWTDPAPLLRASTADGKIVILDAETIEVTLSAAEMRALQGDENYVYDVKVTDPAGAVWKKQREIFPIVGAVTP